MIVMNNLLGLSIIEAKKVKKRLRNKLRIDIFRGCIFFIIFVFILGLIIF